MAVLLALRRSSASPLGTLWWLWGPSGGLRPSGAALVALWRPSKGPLMAQGPSGPSGGSLVALWALWGTVGPLVALGAHWEPSVAALRAI